MKHLLTLSNHRSSSMCLNSIHFCSSCNLIPCVWFCLPVCNHFIVNFSIAKLDPFERYVSHRMFCNSEGYNTLNKFSVIYVSTCNNVMYNWLAAAVCNNFISWILKDGYMYLPSKGQAAKAHRLKRPSEICMYSHHKLNSKMGTCRHFLRREPDGDNENPDRDLLDLTILIVVLYFEREFGRMSISIVRVNIFLY